MDQKAQSDNVYKDLSDDELVKVAQDNIKSSKIGAAQAELVRRNTEALRKSSKSAERYSDILIVLTVLLFLLGMFQLVATIWSSDKVWYFQVPLALLMFGAIYYFMRKLFKVFDEKHGEK